ncbi:MAG: site-specific integrase [Steroidobacteraceae bacterium]
MWYLRDERGLRWPSIQGYAHHLRALERHLSKVGVSKLSELTPQLITEFLTASAQQIHRRGLGGCGSMVRVFLRYLHREGILAKDLSRAVPQGCVYRNASVPRAIPWSDVERAVTRIDRRYPLASGIMRSRCSSPPMDCVHTRSPRSSSTTLRPGRSP